MGPGNWARIALQRPSLLQRRGGLFEVSLISYSSAAVRESIFVGGSPASHRLGAAGVLNIPRVGARGDSRKLSNASLRFHGGERASLDSIRQD